MHEPLADALDSFRDGAGSKPERWLVAAATYVAFLVRAHLQSVHPVPVHMVVKAMSENGTRLNIRKATLRDWRRQFAQQLQREGIRANATERALRGHNRSRKSDGIYRAHRRGESTHMGRRAVAAASSEQEQLATSSGQRRPARDAFGGGTRMERSERRACRERRGSN